MLGFLNKIGTGEIIIIAVLAFIIFGPSRLPAIGKSIGDTIRNFKEGAGIDGSSSKKDDEE